MPAKERPRDRGRRRGRQTLAALVGEARAARIDRGLTLEDVADAMQISPSWLSRIERGLIDSVSIVEMSELLALVGLDLSARAFPAAQPLRDAGHAALLASLRERLHRSLRWATEVPLPIPGDLRAWDAQIAGTSWVFGVEAEMRPTDAQALQRRLALKLRDYGQVDGVIVLLPQTRHVTSFLAAAEPLLGPMFPVPGPRALEVLAAGVAPGGSSIVVADARDGRASRRTFVGRT